MSKQNSQWTPFSTKEQMGQNIRNSVYEKDFLNILTIDALDAYSKLYSLHMADEIKDAKENLNKQTLNRNLTAGIYLGSGLCSTLGVLMGTAPEFLLGGLGLTVLFGASSLYFQNKANKQTVNIVSLKAEQDKAKQILDQTQEEKFLNCVRHEFMEHIKSPDKLRQFATYYNVCNNIELADQMLKDEALNIYAKANLRRDVPVSKLAEYAAHYMDSFIVYELKRAKAPKRAPKSIDVRKETKENGFIINNRQTMQRISDAYNNKTYFITTPTQSY